jgi:hypothetical protein
MLDEEENEKRRNCFYRSINGQPSFWTQHSVREEKELTALLQQRVTCGGNGTPIVNVGVL